MRQKKMGKKSRDKGARNERNLVKIFQEAGLGAERVPLSGACGGSYAGDLTVPVTLMNGGEAKAFDLTFEAKQRAAGFKTLYSWLGENDGLIIGADRKPHLVVLPIQTFIQIVKAGDFAKQRHPAFEVYETVKGVRE